jgi:hypothetical protein
MAKILNIPTINTLEFSAKAQNIYKQIKNQLEKDHKDEYVAIEPDSGDYFLGNDQIEVITKAKKKYPNKIFYLIKIGHEAVITMSSRFKPINYGSIF